MAVLHLLLLLPLISAESLSGQADREGQRVWSDDGSFARYDLTVYEPKRPSSSWFVIGQRAQNNYNDLSTPIYAIKDNTNNNLVRPESFTFIWDDRGSTSFSDASVWRPVCPKDYVAVGDFFADVNRRDSAPNELLEKVRCVAKSLTEPCAGWGNKVWDTDGMWGAEYKASVWEATPLARSGLGGFFYVNNDINRPPSLLPMCLKLSAIKFV